MRRLLEADDLARMLRRLAHAIVESAGAGGGGECGGSGSYSDNGAFQAAGDGGAGGSGIVILRYALP